MLRLDVGLEETLECTTPTMQLHLMSCIGFKIKVKNCKYAGKKTWDRHCSTATADVHRTRQRFFTVHADVTPTNVLPAPTITRRMRQALRILTTAPKQSTLMTTTRSITKEQRDRKNNRFAPLLIIIVINNRLYCNRYKKNACAIQLSTIKSKVKP